MASADKGDKKGAKKESRTERSSKRAAATEVDKSQVILEEGKERKSKRDRHEKSPDIGAGGQEEEKKEGKSSRREKKSSTRKEWITFEQSDQGTRVVTQPWASYGENNCPPPYN